MFIKNHPAQLVFFAGKNRRLCKNIKDKIIKILPEEQINVHKNIETFSSAIQKFGCNHKIILILASTQKELLDIFLLKERLNDRHLILILPDTAQETMFIASKLYPRYTNDIKGNFNDVILVIEKMIKKIKGEENGRGNRYH